MINTTLYVNTVNNAYDIQDFASDNLAQDAVWLNLINKVGRPVGTQTIVVPKQGQLGRVILPEDVQYTYGAYSEYIETQTVLNLEKSVVISRITDEQQTWGRPATAEIIGREQGKALTIGMEEDIAAQVIGFTSQLTAAAPPTMLDLLSCAFNVEVSTNGHAPSNGNMVAVLHPTTAFQVGVQAPLTSAAGGAGLNTIYGADSTTMRRLIETYGENRRIGGFRATIGGVDIFTTNIVDDDGTNFRNLVFDASRAFVGYYDEGVRTGTETQLEWLRDAVASWIYSDFAIHWDEAGCRFLSPI